MPGPVLWVRRRRGRRRFCLAALVGLAVLLALALHQVQAGLAEVRGPSQPLAPAARGLAAAVQGLASGARGLATGAQGLAAGAQELGGRAQAAAARAMAAGRHLADQARRAACLAAQRLSDPPGRLPLCPPPAS